MWKAGDRIVDEFLGAGEVLWTDVANVKGFHMVKFDKTPPIQYNMGENPTCVFESEDATMPLIQMNK